MTAEIEIEGGRGWGTVSDSILGDTRHFFLLTLYNFKNIGGGGVTCPLVPSPCSAVPATENNIETQPDKIHTTSWKKELAMVFTKLVQGTHIPRLNMICCII